MQDNQEQKPPEDSGTPPQYSDWREERRRRRAERRAARRSGVGGWIIGAILVVAGILLLLENFGVVVATNWWALFILLPASGAFATGWRLYKDAGRLTAPARSSFIFGTLLILVTVILLFNLNWAVFGPVLLILAGIAILATVLFR